MSKKFKTEAKSLREQIALLARTLASTFVDSHSIDSLTTCRLISLYQNLEARPIGKREVLRTVISKTINWALKDDIQEATGSLHTTTGLKAGVEAATNAMQTIFKNPLTERVILVATNAMLPTQCKQSLKTH